MKALPSVKLVIEDDPQEYVLTWDINRVIEAEEETGRNFMLALGSGGLALADSRALLYGVLKTSHAVTRDEAGTLLSSDTDAVLDALSRLLKLAGVIKPDIQPVVKEVPTEVTI